MPRIHKRKPKASSATGKRSRIQHHHAKGYKQRYNFPVTTTIDPSIIKEKNPDDAP